MPDVYGTARGRVRARVASPLAARARARRHRRFFALTGVAPGMRVVDVGCGALGLRALEPDLDITGVDLAPRPQYPGPFVQADATERLPFDDGAFDLAYSSSVVEHVAPARRVAFAAEIRRVARGWFVQTPAWSFPIEPHALLPIAHWLPAALRRPYWRLRAAGGFTGRANSALVAGDPGVPFDSALELVSAFYAGHRLPALAQVVLGTAEEQALRDRGWVDARPGQGDVLVQVATVTEARRRGTGAAHDVDLSEQADAAWISRYARAGSADPEVVRALLEGADEVGFARIGTPPVAIGRAAISRELRCGRGRVVRRGVSQRRAFAF